MLHSLSFVDDPTRMLRAVRYEQRYGFAIEPRSLQLMDEARPLLARLSAERIRHELDLILDESKAADMLARLAELGLLKSIVDVLPWSADLRQRLDSAFQLVPAPEWGSGLPVSGIPFRWVLGYSLWLLDLSAAQIERAQTHLCFPQALLKNLLAASALLADLPALGGGSPSQWVARLEGVPLPALYAVWLVSGEKALETYASKWQHIHPKTNGDALKKLGARPGPDYQRILGGLRRAWLDGEISSENDEQILLEKLLKE